MGLVWVWYGSGMGLVWVWYGSSMGLVWAWYGLDLGLVNDVGAQSYDPNLDFLQVYRGSFGHLIDSEKLNFPFPDPKNHVTILIKLFLLIVGLSKISRSIPV